MTLTFLDLGALIVLILIAAFNLYLIWPRPWRIPTLNDHLHWAKELSCHEVAGRTVHVVECQTCKLRMNFRE